MGGRASARAEGVSAHDIRMRTRFGLTLKITARTKSYLRPKMRYFTKQLESQAKLSLFSGSHPCYYSLLTPSLRLYHTAAFICRQTSSVSLRSSSRMRSASSSSPCMTAYSSKASSRLIASIVSSLCGIAIVSTPPMGSLCRP